MGTLVEFNRRYLTFQISILYGDHGDLRKLQSLHWAHLAIFADRGYRRIKSLSVSATIGGENRLRFSLAIKFAAIGV